MTLPKANTAKYRPQLTAAQITHALYLAKLDLGNMDSPNHTESLALISTLSPFKAKIDNAAITASYTPKPRVSTADSLGMDTGVTASSVANPATTTASPTNPANTHASKETYWAACYAKFSANPADCSADEILAANEHAYLNDLMTAEQEAAYESDLAYNSNADTGA